MKIKTWIVLGALSIGQVVWTLPAAAAAGSVIEALAAIKNVGPQGQGTAAAQVAWKRLSKEPPSVLPEVLAAMDGANDYSLNWLRSAVDTIAGAADARLPLRELNRFLENTAHHPRARRLAYELILRADPDGARRMLAAFLNDPSNELRRDAVATVLTEAGAAQGGGKKDEAVTAYRRALNHARDIDQIESAAKALRDLGQTVDLQQTFGWLTRWKLVAPFNNVAGVGFEKAFAPEHNADLGAEYESMTGKVRWQDYETKSEYGLVDFNKPFTQLKGAGGYALGEFYSDKAQTVELRLGCKNAWKIWLNGQYLFGREEYHRGAEIDQYRLRAELKPGRNTILVKCLQNEQKEEWTVEWEFQLRITDAQGTPILSSK
jgi:hypothetical protein